MNETPVYGRLAAIAISGVLALAAGLWMVWVAFIDRSLPNGEPEYFVASDFQHFLRFFIYNSGLAMPGWLFDRSQFEEWDPRFLEIVPEHLQPWNRC